MIGSLLALVLLAAAVAAVANAAQRRGAGAPAAGLTGHSVRRFFQYLLLAGLLFAAGSGVTGLLGTLLDGALDRGETLARDDSTLALQITFTLIALPLWAALAWWTRRRQRSDREEGRALLWTAYLTLVLLVSLVVTMEGFQQGGASLLDRGPVDAGGLVQALVWAVIWWVHRRWAAVSTAPGTLRLERSLGTLIVLVTAAGALVQLLGPALRELLGLTAESLVGTTLPGLQDGAALFAVAGAFWVVYWLRDLGRGPRDTGWLALVLLVGVGAALIAAILAASLLLWTGLVWVVGAPGPVDVREHFAAAPTLLATVVVGVLVWWYHQEVLGARRGAARDEVRRVYEYLMAAVGLLAAAAGLVMVLVTLVEALAAGSDLVVGGSALNALLGASVLLAVGLPVWWWHWRLAQHVRASDPDGEVGSPTRRFYLLVLFGVMGVAAVIALLTLVYLALEDGLAGELGAETLRRTRFALGVLVTASLLSAYHWTVFRADRALAPQVETSGPPPVGRWVLLVGSADPDIAGELGRRTGVRAELLVRVDATDPWSSDDLAEAVSAAPEGDLVVVAGPEGLQVLPVRR